MSRLPPPLSLYIHLPWCVRKCPYCDFNSHRAGDRPPRERYIAALQADLQREARKALRRPVQTVFIGGGTPSLFTPNEIGSILEACRNVLNLGECSEVTMEANPGTVEHGSLRAYRQAGVTRLSLGAQSFDAGALQTLGRVHGPDDIHATYTEAQSAGFDSINLDVMFALPGQNLDAAEADVRALLALAPDHVSYYQLTLEPNTVFFRRPPRDMPDNDRAFGIQELGHRLLAEAGYAQYEISAFARPGHRCRHNLNYWNFGDYLAAGAGAHGKLTSEDGLVRRYQKPANPLLYMERAEQNRLDDAPVPVTGKDLGFEFMLNALRLNDGFDEALLCERTGLLAADIAAIAGQAAADGLLETTDAPGWRPTPCGFRFLNDLQARFLP
jgi:oxygen-independent coproporphyrinogen-3 oxidase